MAEEQVNTSPNKEDKSLANGAPLARRELTAKNRLFLNLLLEGKDTLEAYKLAGYKGEPHAAYQLRSDLKEHLVLALKAQGVDEAGLYGSLKQLMSIPLDSNEVTRGVSVKTKLDILKLLAKMLPPQDAQKPKITAFVVNTRIDTSKSSDSIDTTIEPV